MTGPLSGIGGGQTPFPFGTTFQPGGKNTAGQNTRQNEQSNQTPQETQNTNSLQKQKSVEQRSAISVNESKNETYAPRGEIETRITGDRGSLIDITI